MFPALLSSHQPLGSPVLPLFLSEHTHSRTKSRMTVAIFGAGRAGSIHIENILNMRHLRLKYLVEDDESKAKALLQVHCMEETVRTVKWEDAIQVFEDKDVKAVFVCTPTHTHGEIVLAAVEHGKSVFCEKPISNTVEETARCYEVAEKNNCILFCSFNRRFDPTLRALYEAAVTEKTIGQLQMVKTCARDNPKPSLDYLRISGGIFHDCAVHDLDLVCWLVGEFPISVSAYGLAWDKDIGELNDFDTCFIYLRFPSGVMANIDLSRTAVYGYDQRVELLGEKGMLQTENQRATSLVHYKPKGTSLDPLKYSFQQRYMESYKNCLNHFIGLVEGTTVSEVTRQTVINIALLADACNESAKSGQSVAFHAFG